MKLSCFSSTKMQGRGRVWPQNYCGTRRASPNPIAVRCMRHIDTPRLLETLVRCTRYAFNGSEPLPAAGHKTNRQLAIPLTPMMGKHRGHRPKAASDNPSERPVMIQEWHRSESGTTCTVSAI